MSIKHVNIKIYGRVQGVFFRANTKEKAIKLNLKGFVSNKKDGSVYIEAEGKEKDLSKLLNWCKIPIFTKVERVEYNFTDKLNNFDKFEIIY